MTTPNLITRATAIPLADAVMLLMTEDGTATYHDFYVSLECAQKIAASLSAALADVLTREVSA